ncbi:MAG: integration host factor subunit alpha [Proteobacteria bacterium]|nr:integration host factor subunit alpha [Pseudomonadota bacterium]
MTLTKADIVDTITERLGYSKVKSSETVETVLEIIKDSLEEGDDVLISGFGKLCVKDKAARKGRNPATGADLMLDKRRVVTFKSSTILRNKVNEK